MPNLMIFSNRMFVAYPCGTLRNTLSLYTGRLQKCSSNSIQEPADPEPKSAVCIKDGNVRFNKIPTG